MKMEISPVLVPEKNFSSKDVSYVKLSHEIDPKSDEVKTEMGELFRAPCLDKGFSAARGAGDKQPETVNAGELGAEAESSSLDGRNRDIPSLDVDPECDEMDCCTPREGIFDPFAPGPEKLCMAPKIKAAPEGGVPLRRQLIFDFSEVSPISFQRDLLDEHSDEYIHRAVRELLNDPLCRQLNFDSSEVSPASFQHDPFDEDSDESILRAVCEELDDLVISCYAQEAAAARQMIPAGVGSPQTPLSRPPLSSIAESCPPAPAPTRPWSKLFNLSPSICRKLDFE